VHERYHVFAVERTRRRVSVFVDNHCLNTFTRPREAADAAATVAPLPPAPPTPLGADALAHALSWSELSAELESHGLPARGPTAELAERLAARRAADAATHATAAAAHEAAAAEAAREWPFDEPFYLEAGRGEII